MNYNLQKPCSNCPFRSDKFFHLHPNRVLEIAHGGGEFPCHKTVKRDDGEPQVTTKSEHCAGLMIMLEHMKQPTQMMRIAERIDLYDPSSLQMDSPVYEHVDDYLEAIDHHLYVKRREVGQ